MLGLLPAPSDMPWAGVILTDTHAILYAVIRPPDPAVASSTLPTHDRRVQPEEVFRAWIEVASRLALAPSPARVPRGLGLV
jgi:hypothetical protein